jgi:hypothetical protein
VNSRLSRLHAPLRPMVAVEKHQSIPHSFLTHSLTPSLALWRSRASNADAAAIVGRAELVATPSSLLRVFSALASCALVFRTPRRSFSPRQACRCRPRATAGELCRRGRPVARGQATSVHRGSSCGRRRVRAVPWRLSRPSPAGLAAGTASVAGRTDLLSLSRCSVHANRR